MFFYPIWVFGAGEGGCPPRDWYKTCLCSFLRRKWWWNSVSNPFTTGQNIFVGAVCAQIGCFLLPQMDVG